MDVQVKGFDLPRVAQSLRVNQHLVGHRFILFGLDGLQIVKVLAHHGSHQLQPGQVGDFILAYQLAVPQHGNPVADCVHLLQEVGHEDDADALFPQGAHHPEQLFHFVIVQGGGRLVQDQHLAVHIHCPGDGDHLLQGNGVVFQRLGNVHLDVQFLHQFPCPGHHRLVVDGAQLCQRFTADKQVLRHAQVGTEVYLLVHRGNPVLLGFQGGMVPDGPLFRPHEDLALFKVVDARQALDQGGFSRAVFPHQRVNLTLPERKVHIAQCLYARKGHADSAHAEDHFIAHDCYPFLVFVPDFVFYSFYHPCRGSTTVRRAWYTRFLKWRF